MKEVRISKAEYIDEHPFEHLDTLATYAYIYGQEYTFKLTDQSKFESLYERVSEEAFKREGEDFIWKEAKISFDFPTITVKPL